MLHFVHCIFCLSSPMSNPKLNLKNTYENIFQYVKSFYVTDHDSSLLLILSSSQYVLSHYHLSDSIFWHPFTHGFLDMLFTVFSGRKCIRSVLIFQVLLPNNVLDKFLSLSKYKLYFFSIFLKTSSHTQTMVQFCFFKTLIHLWRNCSASIAI